MKTKLSKPTERRIQRALAKLERTIAAEPTKPKLTRQFLTSLDFWLGQLHRLYWHEVGLCDPRQRKALADDINTLRRFYES